MRKNPVRMNHLTNQTTSGLPVMSETLGTVAARRVGRETKDNNCESDLLERGQADETCSDSLFERFAWLYILCREKLFQDDTKRMIQALWPNEKPVAGTRIVEFGCGPGFYSCHLGALFPQVSVLGIDSSESQLTCAREKAETRHLENCMFECLNVMELPCDDSAFDALIASRLFTVLPKRERAIAEMFRVLRPGGRCFVAEPRQAFRASLPLFSMWLLASLTRFKNGYREPAKATVLSSEKFARLFHTQPWREINTWQDGRYQYALCEKN